MIEIVGVILVCCIINCVNMTSLVFWGIGIGILGAMDEIVSRKKLQMNNWVLVILQAASVLSTSLTLLNEGSVWLVFCVAFGICLYFVLYNQKKENKVLAVSGLIVSCFCICFAFYFVLSIVRFVLFVIFLIIFLGYIYFSKPNSNIKAEV